MRAFDGLAFAQPRSGLGRFPRCGGTELHEVIYLRRLAVALRKGMLRAIYDVMMTARATHAAFVWFLPSSCNGPRSGSKNEIRFFNNYYVSPHHSRLEDIA